MSAPLSQPASPSPDAPAAPGWHQHPDHDAVERYWDGARWSTEYRFALARDDGANHGPTAPVPWTSEQSWVVGALTTSVAASALGVALAAGWVSGREAVLVMLGLSALLGLIVPRHWSAIVIVAILGLLIGTIIEALAQCPPVPFAACAADARSIYGYGVVAAWTSAAGLAGAQALRLLVEHRFTGPRRAPP